MAKNISAADIANRYRTTRSPVSPESVVKRIELMEKSKEERTRRINEGLKGIGKFAISTDKLLRDYKLAKFGGFEGELGRGGLREFIRNPQVSQRFLELGAEKAKTDPTTWSTFSRENTALKTITDPETGSLFNGNFRDNITGFLSGIFNQQGD